VPSELADVVRDAAGRTGLSVSAWLGQAAAHFARTWHSDVASGTMPHSGETGFSADRLAAALDAWQAEDGPFTEAELDAAAARLGPVPLSA
jgi:hypothetical protein